MPSVLETARAQRAAQLEERAALQEELDQLIAAPEAESRDGFDEAEETRFAEIRESIETLDADGSVLDQRIDFLAKQDEARNAATKRREELGLDPVKVTREPRMYEQGNGASYYRDLALSAFNDLDASQRLMRWGTEVATEARNDPSGYEARALNTTTGTGGTFVPPEYLIDQYVPFVREQRPFADACHVMPLPKGTDVIYLPKVSTGTAVAEQATQNTAVTETDLTDAYISAPVKTEAGQQTISLQLIEQSPVNFDEIVSRDLLSALAQTIDNLVITDVLGVSGVNSVTYTSTTPTGKEMYPYVAQAMASVRTNRHAAANHVWMTPDRWYWLASSEDGNGRPLVVPNAQGPFNVAAKAADAPPVYEQAGTFMGAPVFLDSNLPANQGTATNQDVVVVAKQDDIFVYEGAVTSRALPQTLGNQLSVILQVYEYIAVLPNRYPASISLIEGTGLVTPSF